MWPKRRSCTRKASPNEAIFDGVPATDVLSQALSKAALLEPAAAATGPVNAEALRAVEAEAIDGAARSSVAIAVANAVATA
eukprot:2519802-Prymnesium_polylepis.1